MCFGGGGDGGAAAAREQTRMMEAQNKKHDDAVAAGVGKSRNRLCSRSERSGEISFLDKYWKCASERKRLLDFARPAGGTGFVQSDKGEGSLLQQVLSWQRYAPSVRTYAFCRGAQ